MTYEPTDYQLRMEAMQIAAAIATEIIRTNPHAATPMDAVMQNTLAAANTIYEFFRGDTQND